MSNAVVAPTKIALTIKSTYLPSWGAYEGIRELVQNAKDAEREHGAEMVVVHSGTTLVITNDGVTLAREALLLGETSKADRADMIGHFGEGLKLGVLALVRAGHTVTIQTGAEAWTPAFEQALGFDSKVLVFTVTEAKTTRNRVRIEVGNISAEDWKTMKGCFRFLSTRKKDEAVETSAGVLLMAPRMKGRVYVKGIFVQKMDDLRYGYDLTNAPTDRDRKLIHRYDLQSSTRRIWQEALGARPDLTQPFLGLLEANATEIGTIEYYAGDLPEAVIQAAAKQFTDRHGEGALPVANFVESQDVGHLGVRGVIASGPLRAVLTKTFGTIDEAKKKLSDEVTRTYSAHELSTLEAETLINAIKTLQSVEPAWNGAVNVVDYRSATLEGVCKGGGDNAEITIAYRCLKDAAPAKVLQILVHEVAHATTGAGDGDKNHVNAIEELWMKLFVLVTSN